MKRTNKRGFTLVELVVVIAVLLILAAIAIPTVSGVIKKANESADAANATSIETAIKYAITCNETKTLPTISGVDYTNGLTYGEALTISGINVSVLTPKTVATFFYNSTTNDVDLVTGSGYAAIDTNGEGILIAATDIND